LDNNKAIASIGYNYLNLPQLIHFKGKGNISYVYDAAGEKLAKITVDSTASHSVRTLYLDGMVYQQTGTMANPGGTTDTLQFIAHEEGRTRWAYHTYVNGTKAYKFEYDFFEKDHLGNTRMMLTQERDTTNYLASMEFQFRATESKLFSNIQSTSAAWTSMPNYQNILNNIRFAYTSPNDSVSKVDYTGTSGQTTGPSLLLKVMSGDTIMPAVQCYYTSNSLTTTNSSLTSVLNSLAAGIMGTPTGAAEGTLAGYTSSSGPVYGALNSFLTSKDQAPPSGYPKAYLNWVLLDDQFNYVSGSSGAVATASSTYPANQMNLVAPGGPVVMSRNGYLYVWVSNETQGWDVFFDNFTVQYKQGPVLEENHYYPFGLTMAGISDKALKAQYVQNLYRFNGKELQNQEFTDGAGLDEYDYGTRLQDPQLGVWHGIDPLADKGRRWSPYGYALDNPVRFVDPDGMDAEDGTSTYEGYGGGWSTPTYVTIEGTATIEPGKKPSGGNSAKGSSNNQSSSDNSNQNSGQQDSGPNDIIYTSHGVEVYREKTNKESKTVEVGDDYFFDDHGRFITYGIEKTSYGPKNKQSNAPNEKEPDDATDKALETISNYGLVGGTMAAVVDAAMKEGVGAAEELGNLGKVAGRYVKVLGVAATALAAAQTAADIRNHNYGAAIVHGLDAVAGIVGTFGGPWGAAISVAYGFSRSFWGN